MKIVAENILKKLNGENKFACLKKYENGENGRALLSKTQILTYNGTKNICDVQIGDRLANINEKENYVIGICDVKLENSSFIKYNNTLIPPHQIIQNNNDWKKMYHMKNDIETITDSGFHLITTQGMFTICAKSENLLLRDFVEINNLE